MSDDNWRLPIDNCYRLLADCAPGADIDLARAWPASFVTEMVGNPHSEFWHESDAYKWALLLHRAREAGLAVPSKRIAYFTPHKRWQARMGMLVMIAMFIAVPVLAISLR